MHFARSADGTEYPKIGVMMLGDSTQYSEVVREFSLAMCCHHAA